jgi:hypothetical protein
MPFKGPTLAKARLQKDIAPSIYAEGQPVRQAEIEEPEREASTPEKEWKVSTRVVIGGCLGAVAVILVLVSLFPQSWYSATYDGEYYGSPLYVEEEYGAYDATWKWEGEGIGIDWGGERLVVYDDYGGDKPDYLKYIERIPTFLITGIVLAVIFSILALMVGAGRLAQKTTPLRFLPVAFGIASGVILLAGILYFALNFPEGLEDAFLEVYENEPSSASFGYAFYLALAGAVLVLLGALVSVPVKARTIHTE